MTRSRADFEAWKKIQADRLANPRTFEEFVADFTLQPDERKALVLFLAQLRYESTIAALLPCLRNDRADEERRLSKDTTAGD